MASFGGQWTVSATPASLTTILSLSGLSISPNRGLYCKYIIVRNSPGALNALFIGKDNTVTNAPANAIEGLASGASGNVAVFNANPTHGLNTNDFWLVGTANAANFAHITVIY